MNVKHLVAAAALIATGSIAFAGDYQVGGEAYASFPIPSMTKTEASAPANRVTAPVAVAAAASVATTGNTAGKTRAEVIAELTQARSEGQQVGGESYVAFTPATPVRTNGEAVQTANRKASSNQQ